MSSRVKQMLSLDKGVCSLTSRGRSPLLQGKKSAAWKNHFPATSEELKAHCVVFFGEWV